MARTITVKLGDEEVQIEQLRTRQASEWRKSLQGPAREIVGQVSQLTNWASVDLSDPNALGTLVDAATPLLIDSLDTVRDLLVAYAPALRERIESAYDDEIVGAFVQVARLAFPFGQIFEAARGMTTGLSTTPTSPNSPSASGGAGTTS